MPPRYASPFPPLNLSDEEKARLHETAASLVTKGQQLFEKHLWQDNETIDAAQWSLVRKREDVRIFHDRRQGAGTGNDRVVSLLTVGTLQGTLHDAMYGMTAHTTDDMHIRTSYTHDTVLDGAVLETLLAPTDEDPFESMSVLWIVKGVPLLARVVIKPGDTVFLAANGIRQLSNGERVGFNLMHYVISDRAPPLPEYMRVNSSLLVMWRQTAPNRVQTFATLFVESPTVVLPVVVRAVADGLVTLCKGVDSAQRKKLAWLVRRCRDTMNHIPTPVQPICCCVCASLSRSVRTVHRSACAVCKVYVCSPCCVKRQLTFVTQDRRLVEPKLRICVHCLVDAKNLDAAVCARGETMGCALEFDLCGGSGHRRMTWSSSILSLSFSSRVDESFWGRSHSRHSTASEDASMSSGSLSNPTK